MMATLDSFGPKKPFVRKGPFGGKVFKTPDRYAYRKIFIYLSWFLSLVVGSLPLLVFYNFVVS